MYGHSPVHTDDFWAGVTRQMAAFENVNAIMLSDEAGVLRPENAQTLLPTLVEAAGKVPLELHFHNTTGMAPLNYMTGIDAGARIVHTAIGPLADGRPCRRSRAWSEPQAPPALARLDTEPAREASPSALR